MDDSSDHGIWLSTACPPKGQQKAKVSNGRQNKPLSSKIPPRKMMMLGGGLSCGFFTQNSPPPPQLLTARKQSSLTDFFRSTAEDKNVELVQNVKPSRSQATHKTMDAVECVEAVDIRTDVLHHSPTKNLYTPSINTPSTDITPPTEKINTPTKKSNTPSTPIKKINTPIKKLNTPIKKINTPIKKLNTQSVNIDLSTNNLNTSSMSINTPSINITESSDMNSQTNDFTMLTINTTIMSTNTPNLDIYTQSRDINTPNLSTESDDTSGDEKLFTSATDCELDIDKENLEPASLTVSVKENTQRRKLSADEWTFCQVASPQTKKIKLARGVDDDILPFSCQTADTRHKRERPVLSPLKQACLTGILPGKNLADFDSFTFSNSLQLTVAADNQNAAVLQDEKFRRLKEKHLEEMGTLTFTQTLV
ncbi:mucin-2-like [Physella acuta]|uniref:mucin-2-like n=1 Tax=Physella acuta TaxID=109671 RepID=UPI0027DD1A2C|nr:mucin-2-like [Physella acuta]